MAKGLLEYSTKCGRRHWMLGSTQVRKSPHMVQSGEVKSQKRSAKKNTDSSVDKMAPAFTNMANTVASAISPSVKILAQNLLVCLIQKLEFHPVDSGALRHGIQFPRTCTCVRRVRSCDCTNVRIVGGARVPCHSPIRILVSELLSSSMFTLKMMAASFLSILILPVVESGGGEVSGSASGLILNARE